MVQPLQPQQSLKGQVVPLACADGYRRVRICWGYVDFKSLHTASGMFLLQRNVLTHTLLCYTPFICPGHSVPAFPLHLKNIVVTGASLYYGWFGVG